MHKLNSEKAETTLKILIAIFLTFIVFILAKHLFANVGGMPKIFVEKYPPSIFVKLGLLQISLAFLMTFVMIHLCINYVKNKETIMANGRLNGLLFGFSFGVLWVFGFLELPIIYHSDLSRHLLSACRDLISLSSLGFFLGMLFPKKNMTTQNNKMNLLVIPISGIFFCIFHVVQYSITFIGIRQQVESFIQVIYLFALGSWIGFMYHVMNQKNEKAYKKVINFSFNIFGVNWSVFTGFYLLFLDIPIIDILVRCLFDIIGVIIGLLLFEKIKRNHITLALIRKSFLSRLITDASLSK